VVRKLSGVAKVKKELKKLPVVVDGMTNEVKGCRGASCLSDFTRLLSKSLEADQIENAPSHHSESCRQSMYTDRTMTATIKAAVSPIRQRLNAPSSQSTHVIEEDVVSIPASRMPKEFRTLSHFLPVLVLVSRSAVRREDAKDYFASEESTVAKTGQGISSQMDAADACVRASSSDRVEFGEVTVTFSTMEIYREGKPVALTRKGFKMLVYLIRNARRVLSRDELLNQVWGYQCYPCTRTVDNHILQLRKQLETAPARPKHFLTVRGSGYKFLP
jgi:hypothetical protein